MSVDAPLQPILFYPERNAYELQIELSDCPKDLIQAAYDRLSGKVKVRARKNWKMDFFHEFTVPPDCTVNEIHGRLRGDVLHIIMPRSKTGLRSKDAFSNQDGEKVSSDRKTDLPVVAGSAKAEEKEKAAPSAGDEKGVMTAVKETGRAVLAAAMKEENRQTLAICFAVLAAVIGAVSFRSSKKAKD